MKTKTRFFKIWLKSGMIDYVAGDFLADAVQSAGYGLNQLAKSEEK